jgi:uncharacterized SAM-binding protein YcdF (DUF218 family)
VSPQAPGTRPDGLPPQGAGADAVVVLGAQVLGPRRPAPAVRRRVLHGVSVLVEHGAPWLVLAGGVGEAGVSEASVMAALAGDLGVPGERLILEEASRSTLDQAAAVARMARERGWRRVIVVSDRYHLPRALFLFRRMGLEAVGSAARGRGEAPRWRWLGGWGREAAAWVKVAAQAATGRLRRAAAVVEAPPDGR